MTTPADPAGVDYVRRVLEAYRTTPGTTGHLRPADRRLAGDLYLRGVPLQTVLDALLLATARRYGRATPTSLPPTVRSLAYFASIVDEVLSEPLADGYRRYLSGKLDRAFPALGVLR
jgi:hypothetical protein